MDIDLLRHHALGTRSRVDAGQVPGRHVPGHSPGARQISGQQVRPARNGPPYRHHRSPHFPSFAIACCRKHGGSGFSLLDFLASNYNQSRQVSRITLHRSRLNVKHHTGEVFVGGPHSFPDDLVRCGDVAAMLCSHPLSDSAVSTLLPRADGTTYLTAQAWKSDFDMVSLLPRS